MLPAAKQDSQPLTVILTCTNPEAVDQLKTPPTFRFWGLVTAQMFDAPSLVLTGGMTAACSLQSHGHKIGPAYL